MSIFLESLTSSWNVSTRTVETRPEHFLGRSCVSSPFCSQRLNPVFSRRPGSISGTVNVSSIAGKPGHTFGRVNFSSLFGMQRPDFSEQRRPGHISGRVNFFFNFFSFWLTAILILYFLAGPGFTSGTVNVSSIAGKPGHTSGRVNFFFNFFNSWIAATKYFLTFPIYTLLPSSDLLGDKVGLAASCSTQGPLAL